MRGLNRIGEPKVTLIGNLGGNPEIQKLQGNVTVAKFSLATTESFKDVQGQLHSTTDWHTIILWRSLADLAAKYLQKGSLIYVEGKLKTRSYDDKEGSKRYVTEIIGDQIIMLDKPEGAHGN
jgi:single-strand DNA-binding protein